MIDDNKPPSIVEESLQYDLFTNFYGVAGVGELSNNVELWDNIPKYFMSRKEQNKIRTEDGFLKFLRRDFEIKNGQETYQCGVSIQPALLDIEGEEKSFYPSEREELVEAILRKIFEDSNYGVFDESKKNSWVKFTLNMIRKELKAHKHTASEQQVKQSIDILSNSTVTFLINGKEIYRNTIIADLIRVDRDLYVDDSVAMWACRLPSLISLAMESGRYNQYDYGLAMSLKTPLARWIHHLLIMRFVQAGSHNWYNLAFNTVKRDSGLLDAGKKQNQIVKLEKALDELVAFEVIQAGYEKKVTKHGNQIQNVNTEFLQTLIL